MAQQRHVKDAKTEKINFEIDAALFEELGQRLIGRPYIALAELLKNAYDADARLCEVRFEDDAIEIVDDGHGMKPKEFLDRWMRIASTHKLREEESREFGRALTGSKGIGRLSVQFLARSMHLVTRGKGSPHVVEADIDWTQITSGRDLSSVKVAYLVRPKDSDMFANGRSYGVRIRLEGLRDVWTPRDLQSLGRELWMLQPPFPNFRKGADKSGFDVRLWSSDFDLAEAYEEATKAALERNWHARITGWVHRREKSATAQVRIEFKEGYGAPQPEGEDFEFAFPLPHNEEAPSDEPRDERPYVDLAQFEIRIYRRKGRQAAGVKLQEITDYLDEFSGVSIFDAGFRLPYYNRQDWLDIERDFSRRVSASRFLPAEIRQETRAMLDLPPLRNLLGVVSINTSREQKKARAGELDSRKALTLSAGRDRLMNNAAYSQLKHLVRASIDLYANLYRRRSMEAKELELDTELPSKKEERLREILGEVLDQVDKDTANHIDKALNSYVRTANAEAERLRRSLGLFGAIATAGMNAIAFSHELTRETRILDSVLKELRTIARADKNKAVAKVADRLAKSRDSIASLRSLFSTVVDETDREQTGRYDARIVIEEAAKSMRPVLPGVLVDVSGVPKGMRLPRGSLAQWSALFQNVLSNAWNAMLETGGKKIVCEGETQKGQSAIRISDQGVGLGVQLSEADDLFEPFKRKLELKDALRPMMIGGQGVGLAIVRMIAESTGAEVGFVEPKDGYGTTFELTWSDK